MTKNEAILKALEQVSDPEREPGLRILTIARSIFTQNGHDAIDLNLDLVNKLRYCIRARLRRPLTREKILKYKEIPGVKRYLTTGGIIPKVIPTIAGIPNVTINPAVVRPIVTVTLNTLKEAKDFAKLHGGIDQTIEILTALKELVDK